MSQELPADTKLRSQLFDLASVSETFEDFEKRLEEVDLGDLDEDQKRQLTERAWRDAHPTIMETDEVTQLETKLWEDVSNYKTFEEFFDSNKETLQRLRRARGDEYTNQLVAKLEALFGGMTHERTV